MKQDTKRKPAKSTKKNPVEPQKTEAKNKTSLVWWFLLLGSITALFLSPMLSNDFTNWDDEGYVLTNTLLHGPDWKGIFTQPLLGNYHPLAVLSLALNYHLAELNPFSYLLFNLILHVTNTLLVFYFILIISGRKPWVALVTAFIFGLHPMHVESVAWISERKDVLYTLFFLLSLINYWQYLKTAKRRNYWLCFFCFILSLLSKPAAIVLPLVLLLLDYWKGRPFSKKIITEKIIFFILSSVFAALTIHAQSEKAMASLDLYPLWTRLFFACYAMMIYFIRFFIPYPLAAFHPYPNADDLGLAVLLSPLFVIALAVFLWRLRKNKIIVFGLSFFIINLILVLQLVSIGYTIVSERYTYVPYIGLAFIAAMWLNNFHVKTKSALYRVLPALMILVFGVVSFQRTKVWKNSGSLWNDVIKHYKEAAVPHSNLAHYFSKLASETTDPEKVKSLYQQAIAECGIAIQNDPGHYMAYKTRGLDLIQLNRYEEAVPDAESLIRLTPDRDPDHSLGFSMRGTAYMNLHQFEKAIDDFNTRLLIHPDDDATLNKRGASLYNGLKKYEEALSDFDKAIELNPKGAYYLNRSRCYYLLGKTDKAKSDAQMALQKGTVLSDEFKKLLNL